MPLLKETKIDGVKHEIYGFRGELVGIRDENRTHVHTEYLNDRAYVRSTTSNHKQLFLRDKTGIEQSFSLTNWRSLSVRESNNLSILWVIRRGKESGPYVRVINNTTGDSSSLTISSLAKEIRKGRLTYWLPFWLWLVSSVVFGVLAATLGRSDFVNGVTMAAGIATVSGVIGVALLIIYWLPLYIRSRMAASRFLKSADLSNAAQLML